MEPQVQPVALHEATRRRYLSYALSVITSRALPDLRDGLKPVQRRILYAMYHNLHLHPDSRYRKSAAVIGEVMAKYHPHGDQSIYDAMVRMAQPFSLLHTLVDGQGNYGSLDGDPPAAMRYTEARLSKIAIELLQELKKQTVHYRANYDGQFFEPVVLPARFPQILINGTEGIAVGMATKIPPHNLREVIDACVLIIDDPEVSLRKLCGKVKGPDFPMGGRILTSKDDMRTLYETGGGPLVIRGESETEKVGRKTFLILTSLPYGLNKAQLVESIGQLIRERKLPQLTDVRDESTEGIRIVCELRKPQDEVAALAYLYKHTKLQQRYHVNLTCLVPTDNPDVAAPAKLDLKSILQTWLDYRFETVRKRFEYDLRKLRERIHILEGFEKIFDCLDEAIALIRSSEGKRDAAERLMDHFGLDDLQADAILEIKLYKLAKLEILAIRKELSEKRAEAARIEAILASDAELWEVIRTELMELRKEYGVRRRTNIGEDENEVDITYSEDAYIVAEDAFVIATREGWIKRQSSFSDVDKIRIREGDSIGWIVKASTRSTVTFFTDRGIGYTMRVDDIPATTGYGEPVQRHYKFQAGERIVGLVSHDPRNLPEATPVDGDETDLGEGGPFGASVTKNGRGLRFSLKNFAEVSTKNGRKCVRLGTEQDGVVATWVSDGSEYAGIASRKGHILAYPVEEIAVVRSAGKGFLAMKLNPDDEVIAFGLSKSVYEGPEVVTNQGRAETARFSKFKGRRGGKGALVMRRGFFAEWRQEPQFLLGQTEEE
ncbi:MAG: DNA topoisomerase (ATP-hydrolyzing) [Myxococcota bacterium]|nr:DNA topoisomerase (ATP-hydrolyzing) [Myxococcota bacterium]